MLSEGFNSFSSFCWDMYMAKVSTPLVGIGFSPVAHSTSFGPAKQVTVCEQWLALLFRLDSGHHPPPWQLKAPRTPVNCLKIKARENWIKRMSQVLDEQNVPQPLFYLPPHLLTSNALGALINICLEPAQNFQRPEANSLNEAHSRFFIQRLVDKEFHKKPLQEIYHYKIRVGHI